MRAESAYYGEENRQQIINFRQAVRNQYGLRLREEIHAAGFFHHPGTLARIRKDLRLRILRDVLDSQAGILDVIILNIVVDKSTRAATYDIFNNAWMAMIQRFEKKREEPGFEAFLHREIRDPRESRIRGGYTRTCPRRSMPS